MASMNECVTASHVTSWAAIMRASCVTGSRLSGLLMGFPGGQSNLPQESAGATATGQEKRALQGALLNSRPARIELRPADRAYCRAAAGLKERGRAEVAGCRAPRSISRSP